MFNQKQFRKEIALRTFVYFNAVLAYLFTANIWIALGITFALEIVYTLCLMLYFRLNKNKQDYASFVLVDSVLAIVFVFAACFQYMFVEYVFDAAAFIGDGRWLALCGFLFAFQLVRYVLLFGMNEKIIGVVVAVLAVPIFIFFIVLLTNEAFWADAHTAVVASVYVGLTMVVVTLMSLCIGYYAVLVHTSLGAIVLISLWDNHSERSIASYMSN
jgi:hypothetical protein